jgi:hypothetical protein
MKLSEAISRNLLSGYNYISRRPVAAYASFELTTLPDGLLRADVDDVQSDFSEESCKERRAA